MLAAWGTIVYRARWLIAVAAVAAALGSGLWGVGVFGVLTQGGFDDPGSDSVQVKGIVSTTFGQRAPDVVIVYTAPEGRTVEDTEFAQHVVGTLRTLPPDRVVAAIDHWTSKQADLVSADGRSVLALVMLAGDDQAARRASYEAVRDEFGVDGVAVRVGGPVPIEVAMNERSARDLAVAEAVSLPVTLVLLVLIFGSVLAAAIPVVVGALSILGSLGVLRALSGAFEINSFAVNVAVLLGLGMAIDYGLFLVGRFREEVTAGAPTRTAIERTVATAGRTVAFSATLLVIALSGLLVFPMDYLRSMAYGGMAAVAIAALVSLTLLPALLAIAGPRVEVPLRGRHRVRRALPLARIADAVMRRPVLVAAPIVVGLLVLAAPLGGLRFGGADEKQLPPGDPARATAEFVADAFPGIGNQARIVLRGADVEAKAAYLDAAWNVPGVTDVRIAGVRGGDVLLTVPLSGPANSERAATMIDGLRAIPSRAEVLVGGYPAEVADTIDSIADRVPWMLLVLVSATLVLMFLAFGSVLLPIKAVVMSALSLSATFGVLVWVFQEGHGAQWLGVTPQPVQAGLMVLIVALVFGLSTDYETFLLSRMVEARHQGASTEEAVRSGLMRTGRMISSAAVLLAVVTGAFALSALAGMRFLGVGMIAALVIDATVVRILLVPAVLRLFGDRAWWAPARLRRWQEKAGLGESGPVSPVSVARGATRPAPVTDPAVEPGPLRTRR